MVQPMGASSAAPTAKLASLLAERICGDIEADGWELGSRLGNEGELLDRYDISRAVLREAIALLEYRGAVEVRRGHSGGVFVAQSPDEIAIRVMVSHLRALNVSAQEVFEARLVVEGLAVGLASERIDEDSALRLREHVRSEDPFSTHCDFHDAIAEVSRNPLVAVTAQALRRTLVQANPVSSEHFSASRSHAQEAHTAILDAVISGDAPTAVHRMSDHLRTFQAAGDANPTPRTFEPARWRDGVRSIDSREKLAFQLARVLSEQNHGLAPGASLGSEPELLERYGVSRAVLREAIRILEYDGIAQMRKGPRGGLTLGTPDRRSAVLEFERFASYLRLSASQVAEFLMAIELGSLNLVIDRLDQEGSTRLRQVLAAEHAASDAEFDGTAVHAVLNDLTRNRVISFIYGTLRRTFLKRVQSESPELVRFFASHARGAHDGIIEAMVNRDRPLALLRMREHLQQAMAVFAQPDHQPGRTSSIQIVPSRWPDPADLSA